MNTMSPSLEKPVNFFPPSRREWCFWEEISMSPWTRLWIPLRALLICLIKPSARLSLNSRNSPYMTHGVLCPPQLKTTPFFRLLIRNIPGSMIFSQSDLSYLQQSTIEPMFLSDHHPIAITLSFPETCNKMKSWRLNPSLLKDPATIKHLRTRIRLYFTENTSPEVSPISLWEAHKCVIRGKLLALAAKSKKRIPNADKCLNKNYQITRTIS